MISTIKNLYHAENINGEIFLRPLKTYHNFFVKKIKDSIGLRKVAWLITNIVTGIFAYPIFGVLAGLGLLIKLPNISDVSDVKENNGKTKNQIKSLRLGFDMLQDENIDHSYLYSAAGENLIPEWKYQKLEEYEITQKNFDSIFKDIEKTIDVCTSQFKKIFYISRGEIKIENSKIIFCLYMKDQNSGQYITSAELI